MHKLEDDEKVVPIPALELVKADDFYGINTGRYSPCSIVEPYRVEPINELFYWQINENYFLTFALLPLFKGYF